MEIMTVTVAHYPGLLVTWQSMPSYAAMSKSITSFVSDGGDEQAFPGMLLVVSIPCSDIIPGYKRLRDPCVSRCRQAVGAR